MYILTYCIYIYIYIYVLQNSIMPCLVSFMSGMAFIPPVLLFISCKAAQGCALCAVALCDAYLNWLDWLELRRGFGASAPKPQRSAPVY